MLDPIALFEMQFTRVQGGYLYYPSPKLGGRLVSEAEHDALVADLRHVVGWKGKWKEILILIVCLVGWSILDVNFELPDAVLWVLIGGFALTIASRLFWVQSAPSRLVRERPQIAPPRPIAQLKRELRGRFSWRSIGFGVILSGLIFVAALSAPTYELLWWAWTIGSGMVLAAFLWVAFLKFRDARLQQ